MINPLISSMILARLRDTDLVLDVGGGRHPWFRANYVIDRRSMSHQVGETAFGGAPDARPRFSPETWIARDFFDLPWPFADQQFDFTVCMGTLEDLRDPIAIAKEIRRVSKRGYISTPTRAAESFSGLSEHPDSSQLFGYFHHRWFVEIENGDLVFRMKTPLPFQHPQWLIQNMGQHTLNYFWEGAFECREESVAQHDAAMMDFQRFRLLHQQWLDRAGNDPTDAASCCNHWPASWGSKPRFRELPIDHAVATAPRRTG